VKIGKGPKRMGGPSPKFLARKAAEAALRGPAAVPGAPVPTDGPVRVFLDDERACPKGWILARSSAELIRIIGDLGDRIEALSLDWYLGSGHVNGEFIAEDLIKRAGEDPRFLPLLRIVTAHSSDRSRAYNMVRTIELGFHEARDAELPEVNAMACDDYEVARLVEMVI
jgi:hypothetical protein